MRVDVSIQLDHVDREFPLEALAELIGLTFSESATQLYDRIQREEPTSVEGNIHFFECTHESLNINSEEQMAKLSEWVPDDISELEEIEKRERGE